MHPRVHYATAALAFAAAACGSDDRPGAQDDGPPLVEAPLTRFVDTRIGTGGVGFGVGSAYPGPAMPFGMIHAGPDTGKLGRDPDLTHFSGYFYDDDEIFGFSHVRLQGTGANDLGNVLLMPTSGFDAEMAKGQGYRSRFSHDTEVGAAGYYAVTLDAFGVRAELTTARRAALHRYTFPEGTSPTLVVDPTHFAGQSGTVQSATAWVDADGFLRGHVHFLGGMSGRDGGVRIYFAAQADRRVGPVQVFEDGALTADGSFHGTSGGLAVALEGGPGTVHVRIAVSFIDEAQALANLQDESPGFDFEGMRAGAEAAWEEVLGRVRVSDVGETDLRIFYSALYRSFLMPTLFTEAGGRYRGLDREVHVAEGFEYYTDFSLWDTFRSMHPLVVLIDGTVARDFAISITKMIEQGGAVPRWPLATNYTGTMIGSSADIMIADTYLKGVTDFDVDVAFAAMRRQAFEKKPEGARGPWRGGIEEYMALGWVPDEVSVTLEYAYDDWALANLAAALGKTEDEAQLRARGASWENLWFEDAAQLRPRSAAGEFPAVFDERRHGDAYVEGNALQWSWYVPHDAAGLLKRFGSTDAFVARLTELFENSTTMQWVEDGHHHALPDLYYWHSNEPVIHAAYLFADVGRSDLARRWSREVLRTQYRDGPDGLPGNDDSGTMSAWYVFTALGFYPVAGGSEYWLGQPLFERAEVRTNGGLLEIEAVGATDATLPAVEVRLGERRVDQRVEHDALASDTVLEFRLPKD